MAVAILVEDIHQISPTNLAGPGFDILVYFLAVLGSIIVLAITATKSIKRKTVTPLRMLNIVGPIAILILTIYNLFQ